MKKSMLLALVLASIGLGVLQLMNLEQSSASSSTSQTISSDMAEQDLASLGGGSLPVESISLHASMKGGSVDLHWLAETERNNLGFVVLQSEDAEHWTEIGFVSGAGTSQTPVSYDYIDTHPPSESANIFYQLRKINRDGTTEYSKIVTVQNGIVNAVETMVTVRNPYKS